MTRSARPRDARWLGLVVLCAGMLAAAASREEIGVRPAAVDALESEAA